METVCKFYFVQGFFFIRLLCMCMANNTNKSHCGISVKVVLVWLELICNAVYVIDGFYELCI
jgi:hypothetical protein